MPEAKYHAHPALSSTGAKRLLESPLHFKHWRENPEKPKAEFDLGSAIHRDVLGTGYEVEVLDFDSYRTKEAQAARDQARADGKIPLLRHVYEAVRPAREAVLAHPAARLLAEQEGGYEVSVFNTDPETGVAMRCRFDFLPSATSGRRIAWDLKSSGTSAKPAAFARSAARYGYDVSQAHYLHTYAPKGDPDLEFAFVAVEVDPPHAVGVYVLSPEYVEIGTANARRARELFAECSASGEWPGYSDEIVMLPPPVFHVYDFQDNNNE